MKTIGTMLCLASLLLLAACTAGPEEAAGTQDTTLPGAAVATCRVVDVQDGQLILAAADGGENDVYALALGDLPVTYEDPSQTEIVFIISGFAPVCKIWAQFLGRAAL